MDAAKPPAQAATSQTTQTPQSSQGETQVAAPANPGGLVQRAKAAPRTLTPAQVLQLQRTLGNQHVQQLLKPKAPPPVSSPAILQRKIYMGDAKTEFTSADLTLEELNKGEGPRKVSTMAADAQKHTFFKDKAELFAYAAEQTEDIGYLEKENTWIRLPENKLLVLGENHSNTTLSDVVKAVGTRKYIYEYYTEIPAKLYHDSKRVKNAINKQHDQLAEKAGHKEDSKINNHDAETFFPKAVIGLAGLRKKIKDAVWNHDNPTGLPSDNDTDTNNNNNAYSREAAELKILEYAIIVAAKAAKYKVNAQSLWNDHRSIFNTTAKQMRGATALKDTAFVAAIASEKFTYEDFIDSFKAAAQNELVETGEGAAFENFETQHEDWQSTKAPEAEKYERMREFQMLKKIIKAKGSGYKLAGIGDAHRAHLEKILDSEDGIQARKLNAAASDAPTAKPIFVDEQKARHTP